LIFTENIGKLPTDFAVPVNFEPYALPPLFPNISIHKIKDNPVSDDDDDDHL